MRRAWCALVLVVAALGVPGAPAEVDLAAPALRVPDAQGDVQEERSLLGAPLQGHDHVDIIEGWLGSETEHEIHIGVKLVDIRAPQDDGAAVDRDFNALFFVGGLVYGIQLGETTRCYGGAYITRGSQIEPTCLEVWIDHAASSFVFQVPKNLLWDEDGRAVVRGDQILGLRVRASAEFSDGKLVDEAKDMEAAVPFEFAKGAWWDGPVVMAAEHPLRKSNGGETNLVYDISLANTGDERIEWFLAASVDSASVQVRVPGRLSLDPQATVHVPVIVSLPPGHAHGESLIIFVEGESQQGHRAGVPLGVHWLDVPQPAGHHNGLFFHSKPDGGAPLLGGSTSMVLWVNTLDADDERQATDDPAPPNRALPAMDTPAGAFAPTVHQWAFNLDPRLFMGLDFVTEETARMEFALVNSFPALESRVTVGLHFCTIDRDGSRPYDTCRSDDLYDIPLGAGTQTTGVIPAGSKTDYEIDVELFEAADLVPYEQGANLLVTVKADYVLPSHASSIKPTMDVDGARLWLPLLEYSDPLDDRFEDVELLSLQPITSDRASVNPGRSSVLAFNVTNKADVARTVDLDIVAHDREAITVWPQRVSLEPGGHAVVQVATTVAANTAPGATAAGFLVAEVPASVNAVAVSRFVFDVVDPAVQDIPDQPVPTERGPKKESPAPGLMLMMILGGVLLVQRGRRRGFYKA